MKIAYFDCFAGISGDMCLGALVDAGVDIKSIGQELKKIPLKGYRLTSKKVLRCGISATKVDVLIQDNKGQKSANRKWKDIEKIIETSSLSEDIKQKGLHLFKKLFEAEAKVHGESFDSVHLHELGAVDCMVDIFGTLIGLNILGIDKIYTSAINLGSGTVKTTHGMLPVPAPATIELLKNYPVYASDIPFEMTTPTGALIIAGFKAGLSFPKMQIEKIGYGAGNKDVANMPNAVRVLIGQESDISESQDIVTIIEVNIDDMNPQIYEHVIEKLFKAGALDVFLENIMMKKGRPAVKLSAMAHERDANDLINIIFEETTTIGLRFYNAQRKTLEREIKKIKTKFGDVRIKIAVLNGNIVNISPEYDDIKILSKKTGLPIKKIAAEVLKVYEKNSYISRTGQQG